MSSFMLSVIIPSYNEKENIERGVLEDVYAYLKKQSYSWEMILSDDGSNDGSPALLQAFADKHKGVRVQLNPHAGKGPNVIAGLKAAKGDLKLFTDFDQATPITEVEKLLPMIQQGYDVAIGSREIVGARREKEPFYRHLMGKGFNMFVQLLTVRGIRDTQCGFKLFTAASIDKLLPLLYVYKPRGERSDAFTGAFDVELLYLAQKFGMKIAEVPVSWQYVKTVRVSPIKDSLRMLFDLMKIRAADISGKYSKTS